MQSTRSANDQGDGHGELRPVYHRGGVCRHQRSERRLQVPAPRRQGHSRRQTVSRQQRMPHTHTKWCGIQHQMGRTVGRSVRWQPAFTPDSTLTLQLLFFRFCPTASAIRTVYCWRAPLELGGAQDAFGIQNGNSRAFRGHHCQSCGREWSTAGYLVWLSACGTSRDTVARRDQSRAGIAFWVWSVSGWYCLWFCALVQKQHC